MIESQNTLLITNDRDRAAIDQGTQRTTLGDRAFPVTAAARAWNALPSSVRSAPSSLLQFRRDLKTALHVYFIFCYSPIR